MLKRLAVTIALTLAALSVCLICLPTPALATGVSTLTLKYKSSGDLLANAPFELYKVGHVVDGRVVLDAPFDGYVGDTSITDAVDMAHLSTELQLFASSNSIGAVSSAVTNSDGLCVFTELLPALYLVSGGDIDLSGVPYTAQPFLVSCPMALGNTYSYDLTAEPKHVRVGDNLSGTTDGNSNLNDGNSVLDNGDDNGLVDNSFSGSSSELPSSDDGIRISGVANDVVDSGVMTSPGASVVNQTHIPDDNAPLASGALLSTGEFIIALVALCSVIVCAVIAFVVCRKTTK